MQRFILNGNAFNACRHVTSRRVAQRSVLTSIVIEITKRVAWHARKYAAVFHSLWFI
jgi:hypothetical protein